MAKIKKMSAVPIPFQGKRVLIYDSSKQRQFHFDYRLYLQESKFYNMRRAWLWIRQ
jgi:hypothetical protein